MKSPVSRVGNKSAILHILYPMFPLSYHNYVEVFGGSGSVLLGKPAIDPMEVYNDLDKDLVNLFRCIRERPMALLHELGFYHLNSREDFKQVKRLLKADHLESPFLAEELALTEVMFPPPQAEELKELILHKTKDYDVRRAAMFLRLSHFSYASGGRAYGCQPYDMRKLVDLIQQCSDRMQNVVVENQDFETLIRHYDRPETFFYLDPPYMDTEDMYDAPFGKKDHQRLRKLLGEIQGKFLLSYNDCPEIRELYRSYELFAFSRPHTMAQRYAPGSEYGELLLANYDLWEREANKPRQLTLFDDDWRNLA